jgi:thiamine-monophosphate kinase
MKKQDTSEGSLIERIVRTAARWDFALTVPAGDDAAIWRPRPGYETILTCDWFLEGSHFLADRHPADSIGWKCLARAVSDIAAMGGMPRCFLLSLALPPLRTGTWLKNFLAGLTKASRALRCSLAGGDTTRRDEILVNITVVGECGRGRAILRSGARNGDGIFVTGRLGEAEYGLRQLNTRKKIPTLRNRSLARLLYPEPRLAIGAWLSQRRLATAMMDLSDGLSTDLAKLCAASGTGARISAQQIPSVRTAPRDHRKFDATELALHGGDDYELLFTVAKRNIARIPKVLRGVALTQVGEITARKEILLDRAGQPLQELKSQGWDPFRS